MGGWAGASQGRVASKFFQIGEGQASFVRIHGRVTRFSASFFYSRLFLFVLLTCKFFGRLKFVRTSKATRQDQSTIFSKNAIKILSSPKLT